MPAGGSASPGGGQLVPGGEHRHPEEPPQLQIRQAERARQGDVPGPETRAGADREAAPRDVLAGPTAIGAGREAGRQDHGVAVDPGILLHRHGIGAGGHRCAGEDSHCDARVGPGWGVTGRHTPAERQARLPGGREIARPYSVAVHRGVIERRQVDRRDQVFGQHASVRIGERHRLAPGEHRQPRPDQRHGVGDPHRGGRDVEAVAAQAAHRGCGAVSIGGRGRVGTGGLAGCGAPACGIGPARSSPEPWLQPVRSSTLPPP
jgi:hypothetical protein